jgi:hypothetical protein
MKQQIEKIKIHFKENKTVYLTSASCLAIGVTIGVLLKNRPQITIAPVIAPVITASPVFNNNPNNVNFGGYAHKLVKCLETGEIWETVTETAKTAGVTASAMSRHLNGHKPHIDDFHYEIIGLGTV